MPIFSLFCYTLKCYRSTGYFERDYTIAPPKIQFRIAIPRRGSASYRYCPERSAVSIERVESYILRVSRCLARSVSRFVPTNEPSGSLAGITVEEDLPPADTRDPSYVQVFFFLPFLHPHSEQFIYFFPLYNITLRLNGNSQLIPACLLSVSGKFNTGENLQYRAVDNERR